MNKDSHESLCVFMQFATAVASAAATLKAIHYDSDYNILIYKKYLLN